MLDDIEFKAIKTGMLYDAEHTRRIVRTLKAHFKSDEGRSMPPLVVDPVSVSTSGHTLLHPGAVDVMVQELFPLATLVTPNTPETELLLSRTADGSHGDTGPTTIATLEDMLAASERLLALGPKAILIKGGHVVATFEDVRRVRTARSEVTIIQESLLDDNMEILQANEVDLGASPLVVDVLRESDGGVTLFVSPRIESTSTHGTGCTLAAAIASLLGKGESSAYPHDGLETLAEMLLTSSSPRGGPASHDLHAYRDRDGLPGGKRVRPFEPHAWADEESSAPVSKSNSILYARGTHHLISIGRPRAIHTRSLGSSSSRRNRLGKSMWSTTSSSSSREARSLRSASSISSSQSPTSPKAFPASNIRAFNQAGLPLSQILRARIRVTPLVPTTILMLTNRPTTHSLLVAKSSTYSSIQSATQTIINIINEVTTHKSFCTQWGISEAELNTTPESPSTTAYGAYILDVGLQGPLPSLSLLYHDTANVGDGQWEIGDSAKLIMALAACLLGYGEVGLWLQREAARPESWVVLQGNPYLRWIEDYSGKEYQAAVRLGLGASLVSLSLT